MKAIMRSLITILALAGTSAFAIAAPEATAMWDKNLANSSTVNGYTMGLGTGTSATDGIVTIGSETSGGITINKSSNHATDFTMIFKVANLPATSSGEMFLVSARSTSKVNDPVGIYFDGLTPKRIKGGDRSADSSATANAIVEGTGERTFAFIHNKQNNKLYLYEIVGEEAQLKYEGSTGFGNDNPNTSGVNIGAPKAASSSGAIPACANMTVSGVALFETVLTADEIGAFKFPSDDTPTVPGIISINITNANTTDVNSNIQTLASDDAIPAGGWINVGYPANNGERKGSTSTVKYAKGTETGTVSGATFTWTSEGTAFQNMLNGIGSSITFMKDAYCRGSGATLEGSTLTLTGVPYSTYDVIVYISGKTANVNKSITVNGTAYYGGTVDDAHPYGTYIGDSTSWGSVDAPSTLVMGQNAIRITDQTESTLVISTPNPFGGNWGVAAIQVIERNGGVQTKATATISGDTTWGDLEWDPSAPTVNDKVELTVSANAKLTIDDDTAFKSLKLIGARNLTIAGITSSNVALLPKISIGSFTGKLTFEIDASAGFTADDTLKNLIKSASTQYTFVFNSTVANKGAAINYGTSVNATLNSHIVFNGGTHAFTFGQSVETKDFGANASHENPTVWVKGGATLNFTGKDLTGWNGTANANGVIRVDNGATLNFLADGRNTVYYRQRLCLEPGAKVTFPDTTGANDNKPVMRFLGGAAENNEVIYVLPPIGNATTATISGNIFFAKDNTHGFGVFVDSNSRLKWVGNMLVYDDNDDKAIVKRGAGVLEYSGTMDGVVQVAAGAIGGNGSFRKLTFGENGALDLNNGAPTITGSLVTAVEKQLKLVIDNPTHMMEVITLPAAADKTGWTAIVNGREAENELIVDGNTLKLKWRIPPTIDVDIDDITIESTSDWNGGTVKIDVSSLEENDYTGEITYRLKFGDKTVDGSVEDNVATFTLDDYFTAGNIYRGIFELEYGDAGDKIEAAEVIVYEGKLTYADKEGLWVNETPDTLRKTGAYNPDNDVSTEDGVIKIDTQDKVTFYPTLDPDYVDKCDSELTMTIFASEAVDDDMSVEEGAQAGVMIISDGSNGVAFYFIDGGKEEWVKGPAAELNKDYVVTISFHYAKDASDTDSVTYTSDRFTDSYTYAHRPNTADKVTEIVFADGTRFKSLIGTCQIEVADPVAQGIKPGETQEITADNDDEAQEKAAKIPVMIPEDDADVIAALDTDAKKDKYKKYFKVVAVKKNGAYIAEVVFAEEAKKDIKDDEEKILTEVVSALSSLLGEEGELENITGQPGLYYGIASDGELVKMDNAQPDDWKIAGADGTIVGLKVKKTASAKQGFYKVICTPRKPDK